jgi:hypothetical protein
VEAPVFSFFAVLDFFVPAGLAGPAGCDSAIGLDVELIGVAIGSSWCWKEVQ